MDFPYLMRFLVKNGRGWGKVVEDFMGVLMGLRGFMGFSRVLRGFLMEIENSRGFWIFGIFKVCLELQRGQVVLEKKNHKKIDKGYRLEDYLKIITKLNPHR